MAIDTSCPSVQLNPLQMSGLSLSIVAFPQLTFWVKEANLPDITLQEVNISTPLSDIPFHGDKLQFGSLDVRILVDEYMNNYYNLFKWITLVGFPNDYTEVDQWRKKNNNLYPFFKDTELNLVTDIRLEIKGANSETVRVVVYEDAVITSLGSISFADESTDTQYATFNVSFKFRQFRFVD